MAWLSTLLLVLAVSIDSLAVGFTYGLKKLNVPPVALVVLSTVSALGMLISMFLGRSVGVLIGEWSRVVGSSILILMGIVSFLSARYFQRQRLSSRPSCSKRMTPLEMVVRVVKEPMEADLDSSGEIGITEAILLGTALALDSVGAGIGAALVAYPPAITSLLAGILTLVTLNLGLHTGRRVDLPENSWVDFAPGILLLLLGAWRLL
ncbi:MAG TPA: sporulation membrane protein YtaF [Firmicutes bacterium]|nr:sporulation membrane protein YtaF [Bacillota bacterium]